MYTLNAGLSADPHQVVAREFILSRPRGGAAAWLEPGLGKSFVGTECLMEWLHTPGIDRALIICPAGLVEDWRMKLQRYASIPSLLWDETTEHDKGVFLISHTLLQEPRPKRPFEYNRFFIALCLIQAWYLALHMQFKKPRAPRRNRVPELCKWKPQVVILDEGHRFKSYRASQTKGLLKFIDYVRPRYRLEMTGTPITTKDPEEFRPQLLFVDQVWLAANNVAEWKSWRKRFCAIRTEVYGSVVVDKVVGVKNQPALDTLLEAVAIKQTSDVLDLPPEQFDTTFYRMSKKATKYYRTMAAKGAVLDGDLEITSENALSRVMRCSQLRSGFAVDFDGKAHVIDDNLIETAVELTLSISSPLLLVYNFTLTGDRLVTALEKHKLRVARIRGGINASKKTMIEQEFQNGKLDVVVAQYEAVSLGFTFTRGNHIIFAEPQNKLEAWDQTLKRIRRRGTTKTSFYHLLIEPSTLDQLNYDALRDKQDFGALITKGVIRL